MAEGKVIIVNPDMFGKDPDSKTTKANEVAKSFGLSDAALAEVEDFRHNSPNTTPGICVHGIRQRGWQRLRARWPWCTTRGTPTKHSALPKDVQTAFAIRMLFTHRPVDRYGASMFLIQRGFNVKFEGIGNVDWYTISSCCLAWPPAARHRRIRETLVRAMRMMCSEVFSK